MPDREATGPEQPDAMVATVLELVERVGALATELAELRTSMAREIRSRRVVVVEADGFERIVLGAREQYGHVAVLSRAPTGASTSAELFAHDPVDADGANVGVALTDRGEVVATLDVTHDHAPRWWTDADPGEHT
jgi:hypothetical protein